MLRLRQHISSPLARGEAISATDWADVIEKVPKPIFPISGGTVGAISWAACRGATDEARGYPCGLWLLFHTLVAHSVDASAVATLRAIRGYVQHFFGCNACARHFAGMASDEALEGIDRTDAAALWLWRAHNAVNMRLNHSGEATVLRFGLPKLQEIDCSGATKHDYNTNLIGSNPCTRRKCTPRRALNVDTRVEQRVVQRVGQRAEERVEP